MEIQKTIISIFESIVNGLDKVLFVKIYEFPLIVILLFVGAFIFTLYFRFINIRGFSHAVNIIKGKYDNPEDTGQISHFQALTSALSATIGLGNIGGVAIAVSMGGAGTVFWMILIAFFSMSSKFVSCTLGQMYRRVNSDGSVNGGPMYYLKYGLEDVYKDGKFIKTFGKFLAILYAIFIIGGAFGGGNMFQANQSYELFGKLIGLPDFIYGIIMAILVGIVIIGGIKRIAQTTEKIVPLMVVIYVGASLFIIFSNISQIPTVVSSIINEAFTPRAFVVGGFVAVLVLGVKRAVFSNEGGVGSAAIAHSAAKTDEPVREGIVAMVGPFIDTIVVCFMTASVIIITSSDNPLDTLDERDMLISMYQEAGIDNNSADKNLLMLNTLNDHGIDSLSTIYGWNFTIKKHKLNKTDALIVGETYPFDNDTLRISYDLEKKDFIDKIQGAELTSAAYATAIWWFPYILAVVVLLFSYSTMISWYYYGNKGWKYLFGDKGIIIYQIMYLFCTFLGSIAALELVNNFSMLMILSCAFPNIIGCLFLLPTIKRKSDDYWKRYKANSFQVYK